ncbi:hypothetical protein B194_3420 [Serratia plymuthica A30]|jgi:hypothetical protein|nr:hypothetical protein B194_3420 [Serratia plymuthica A30]
MIINYIDAKTSLTLAVSLKSSRVFIGKKKITTSLTPGLIR